MIAKRIKQYQLKLGAWDVSSHWSMIAAMSAVRYVLILMGRLLESSINVYIQYKKREKKKVNANLKEKK